MNRKITISCKKALSREDFGHVYEIRRLVFVEEQFVPPELEKDCNDDSALHILALLDGIPVGTGRLVQKAARKGKIGRIAVIKEARNKGIGRILIEKLTNFAREMKHAELFLDAQLPAVTYYEKMGFHATGEIFIDAGIPHRQMYRILTGGRELPQSQENPGHQEEEH